MTSLLGKQGHSRKMIRDRLLTFAGIKTVNYGKSD
jgi:hypothetical protein